MSRIVGVALFVVAGLGACGGVHDDRPRTLEYITKAILAPSCASAECHSTFSQSGRRPKNPGDPTIPLVFDTVMGARLSIYNDGAIVDHFEADADQLPTLIVNLTVEHADAPRMPLDRPLPDADIELLHDWILLGGPGACVNDKKAGALIGSCNGKKLYSCTDTLAFDKLISTCVPAKT